MPRSIQLLLLFSMAGGAFFGGFQLREWRKRRERPPLPAALAAARARATMPAPADLAALQALGYVEGTVDPTPGKNGVIHYDRRRAHPGYNFYNSRNQAGAQVIDMEGEVLHSWSYGDVPWMHATLLGNGDVLVNIKHEVLIKLDRDSKIVWAHDANVHHDLWVAGDGDIYANTRSPARRPEIHEKVDSLVDEITILSEDGQLKEVISLLDVLEGSKFAFLFPSLAGRRVRKLLGSGNLDLLHNNHVQVLDGRHARRDPIFAKGNMLVSLRNINAIAIVDGGTRELVWLWGPNNLTFQHHPTLLENGNVLIFDNGRERSRILEVNPLTLEIVWAYAPSEGFFSRTRGSVQRLQNGNTLITESNTGYVLEVTPSGEKVWEFANPDVSSGHLRRAIWRMTRFAPSQLPFLREG